LLPGGHNQILTGVINTWILTLPGCVLWLFSWYDGWNNSFHKGYEQAAVGPLTGILGVVLFIAAMFYVPLAQVRQAVTGQWRAFYQGRLIWQVLRCRWRACLGLAALYSLIALPVNVLRTLPAFFPQLNPALNGLTTTEAQEILKPYFFWSAAVVFPAYVGLRLAAARIYASGVLTLLQEGSLRLADLSTGERETLQRLDLVSAQLPLTGQSSLLKRLGAPLQFITVGVVMALVWFIFVAQIYVSEFLNYHPVSGWLNQPLVQMPWFRDLPSTPP